MRGRGAAGSQEPALLSDDLPCLWPATLRHDFPDSERAEALQQSPDPLPSEGLVDSPIDEWVIHLLNQDLPRSK